MLELVRLVPDFMSIERQGLAVWSGRVLGYHVVSTKSRRSGEKPGNEGMEVDS